MQKVLNFGNKAKEVIKNRNIRVRAVGPNTSVKVKKVKRPILFDYTVLFI